MQIPLGRIGNPFRQAMLLAGVDMLPNGGWLTAAHSREDLDKTTIAFTKAIQMLQQEGIL